MSAAERIVGMDRAPPDLQVFGYVIEAGGERARPSFHYWCSGCEGCEVWHSHSYTPGHMSRSRHANCKAGSDQVECIVIAIADKAMTARIEANEPPPGETHPGLILDERGLPEYIRNRIVGLLEAELARPNRNSAQVEAIFADAYYFFRALESVSAGVVRESHVRQAAAQLRGDDDLCGRFTASDNSGIAHSPGDEMLSPSGMIRNLRDVLQGIIESLGELANDPELVWSPYWQRSIKGALFNGMLMTRAWRSNSPGGASPVCERQIDQAVSDGWREYERQVNRSAKRAYELHLSSSTPERRAA
jgi:hypothetical protein